MRIAERCKRDIVIDTNVLSHADNPASPLQANASELLGWMRDSAVKWVLDDNGKSQPDPHTSLLFAEYRETLPPGGVGLQLLIFCLANGRVVFANRPDDALRKEIRKLIPKNRKDQVVLGAAAGSRDRLLASNDYADFTSVVRKVLHKKHSIDVVAVDELDCA
ncbi:hypothetical protein [Brachybacterium sp. SGAir0954]|uniref:hypothetical protein n=1 Tax=Brachybacterium sp. SGAir0954 TaxID=2571029 RepID=UPI0010F893CB|nr:hypothetical protein [Brachybacterium sp. SGAir0954]